ncbi:MAG: SusC/RagA family TonB-linked outer membrane protein [Bacteroidetes bacterium]|nr:SusC/RagA family TonB-linked outer membrane protein [Bacteroidota bacterium]
MQLQKIANKRGCRYMPLPKRKITTVLYLCLFLYLLPASRGMAQRISLGLVNVGLDSAIHLVEAQSPYRFVYTTEQLRGTLRISVNVKNETIEKLLRILFKDQPLAYRLEDNLVILQNKEAQPVKQSVSDFVSGQVFDHKGSPIEGASIMIKGSSKATTSNAQGGFRLDIGANEKVLLQVSFVGYTTRELWASPGTVLQITLSLAENGLDAVEIIGYGTTTQRYATGSISKVGASEIEAQPVTNLLSALSGRSAGVFVQTTNGLPGGGVDIQIRGRGSIAAGTAPLYVVDGVPFVSSLMEPNNFMVVGSINGATSPFNSLNPDDIESISILKDADATAIYGSRGANGVVLITTKKGKTGKTKLTTNFYTGIDKVANMPKLMGLGEYLQLRREAFKNDGLIPSADPSNRKTYAPDLMEWDTTKSTDWAKYMMGGVGRVLDVQSSLSGGDRSTNFLLATNYRTQSTVLPGDNMYERIGVHFNLQHAPVDKKFSVFVSTTYNKDNNKLANPSYDFSSDILLPPNYPLYNTNGDLNYYAGINPIGNLKATTKTKMDNLIFNSVIKYKLVRSLNFSTSIGYSQLSFTQLIKNPTASLYPGTPNNALSANKSNETFIVEPQFDYHLSGAKSELLLLLGGTYQSQTQKLQYISAKNFLNESLIESLGSAQSYYLSNAFNAYKYLSFFGRATYTYSKKYILNATVRRDGSSKFGDKKPFGNFGSIAAAWLFGSEKWFSKNIPILSYGKLHASYGLTGNDQIPDYQFLSTYTTSFLYQDTMGLKPTRAANPDFHWETTKKLEWGIDLSFKKDRFLISVDYYKNSSSDQLVAYALPAYTGFTSYQANLPAIVINTGWEFELVTKNITGKNFSWSTNFNITLPKNWLKRFPGIENSSYANTLKVGEDITRVYGYRLQGLDTLGKPIFATDPSVNPSQPYYYFTIGKRTPNYFGGLGNSFSYKRWALDIFCQFSSQILQGGLKKTPGLVSNNFSLMMHRWQNPADNTVIPAPSTYSNTLYQYSSANWFGSSYWRFKNISLSYHIPSSKMGKFKWDKFICYIRAQNLFTIWDKSIPIYDPETGASNNIPSMKSFVLGFQLTL